MGIKKKHVPGCSCCNPPTTCDCSYGASNGNEYTDAFGTADAGWLEDVDAENTFSVSGGHGILTWDSGTLSNDHHLYRTKTVASMTDFFLVLEVLNYQTANSDESGLFWADPTLVSIRARWNDGDYQVTHNGVPITGLGSAPGSGDKLTIKAFRIGTSGAGFARLHYCYFVNETLVYETENTADYTGGATRYGMFAIPEAVSAPVAIGEWDNFTFQLFGASESCDDTCVSCTGGSPENLSILVSDMGLNGGSDPDACCTDLNDVWYTMHHPDPNDASDVLWDVGSGDAPNADCRWVYYEPWCSSKTLVFNVYFTSTQVRVVMRIALTAAPNTVYYRLDWTESITPPIDCCDLPTLSSPTETTTSAEIDCDSTAGLTTIVLSSAHCCGRPDPTTGDADDLPSTLSSEIVDYTCECLDNTSNSESVQCLTGIDGQDFTWGGSSPNQWTMTGDVFCDDGDGFESCELSRETFELECGGGGGGDCQDWSLTLRGDVGCTPVTVYPEPGFSCDPFDMTFVIPVTGCNCNPPVTGVCDCSITMRIYEP